MILKKEHIHFRCQDHKAAAVFFTDVLGGRVSGMVEGPPVEIIRVDLAGKTFAFSPAREGMEVEPNSGRPRYGVCQLAFEVDDVVQVFEQMKAKGVEFNAEPFSPREGVTVALAKGPEDVEIELMQKS